MLSRSLVDCANEAALCYRLVVMELVVLVSQDRLTGAAA